MKESTKAMLERGQARFLKGDIDAAVSAYEGAVEADPDSPEAHYRLGAGQYVKGRIDTALEHLERALNLAAPVWSRRKAALLLIKSIKDGSVIEV